MMMIQSFPLMLYLLGLLCITRSLPVQRRGDNGLRFPDLEEEFMTDVSNFIGQSNEDGTGIGLNMDTESGLNMGNAKDLGVFDVGSGLDIDSQLGLDAYVGTGLGYDADLNMGKYAGTYDAAGFGATTSLDSRRGMSSVAGLNFGVNTGLGLSEGTFIGTNAGTGAGTFIGTNAGTGANFETRLGFGNDVAAGLDFDTGIGIDSSLNGAALLGTRIGVGTRTGRRAETNGGAALNVGLGAGINNDLKAGLNAGLGAGINNLRTGLNVVVEDGFNNDLGAGLNTNLGVALNPETATDMDVDLTISEEDFEIFNEELKIKLRKNKYFQDAFSDYVSSSALKLIIAAMTQYISEAFSIPRSYILPLENDMINIPRDIPSSTSFYADIIANSLTNIFIKLNLIRRETVKLQAEMAAIAISSGIKTFLRVASYPGIGVLISSNSYNSYFSSLNGLGKLPYIGIDTISKLPPIIKTATAIKSAQKFAKTLFYKLIYSNKFYEGFTLGIPACTYKTISNALGIAMAEAFGSLNPALFSNIYSAALLTNGRKLDYRRYARAISLATAKCLYLFGYFSSGDVNIQSAIATNAINRALTVGLRSVPTQFYTDTMGLPWTMQLAGVAPSGLLNTDIGIGANVKVDVGQGINVRLGSNIGNGVGVNLGAGARLGANLGVATGLGSNLRIGVGLGTSLGDDTGLGTNFGVDAGLTANVESNAGLDDIIDANGDNEATVTNQEDNQNDAHSKYGKRDINNLFNLDDPNFSKKDIYLNGDDGANLNAATLANTDLRANLGLGIGNNAVLGSRIAADSNLGAGTGVDIQLGVRRGNSEKVALTILQVLPQMLENKFYQSTALSTSLSIVDIHNVIHLIAQSIAVEFGFPIAAAFLNAYKKNFPNNSDITFASNATALAHALSVALAEAGILNSKFTVLTASQLATAVSAKISSLIATSLEKSDWSGRSTWTLSLGQDAFQPPLTPVHFLLK